jgi:hypothetical protein
MLRLGVVLFVLSFFAPLPELNLRSIQWNFCYGSYVPWIPFCLFDLARPIQWNFCYGFFTFFFALTIFLRSCAEPLDWRMTVGVLGLGVALSANFWVLLRFPRRLLLLPILAPWAIALFYWSISNTTGFLSFPLFYPWALGIALIHGSRYFEAKPRQPWFQTA